MDRIEEIARAIEEARHSYVPGDDWEPSDREIAVARAAYEVMARSDGWLPIESALKDGTRMLAWWPHLKQPVIAWISQGGLSRGRWTFASFRFEHLSPVVEPTHWRPLPDPPSVHGSSSIDIPSAVLNALASIGLTAAGSPLGVYPKAQFEFNDGVLAVTIWDDRSERVQELGDAVERAIASAPIESVLRRRRTVHDVSGTWACVIDFRVKAMTAQAQSHSPPLSEEEKAS